MSHLKERTEKNCLNCNAQITDRYCSICGQENIEPKENFGHLLSHFLQDLTHFDSKFFSSLKLLILKPGFLSIEYMKGRRMSYLNPIRMYVFTSAIFFLIFFSVEHYNLTPTTTVDNGHKKASTNDLIKMDESTYKNFINEIVKTDSTMKFAYNKKMYLKYLDSLESNPININDVEFNTKKDLDSAIAHGKQVGLLERYILNKKIEIKQKNNGNPKAFQTEFINNLLHTLPKLMFVSLPLFALILSFLYFRQNKIYYVNHLIFALHLFVFVFIASLFILIISRLKTIYHLRWMGYINSLICLLIFFYNYKAMRNFYNQGRVKTILKFLILNALNLVTLIILFIVASIFVVMV